MQTAQQKAMAHVAIGALLKAHREAIDMSQKDIANILGYRNVNFISMVESGRSNVPMDRIIDVVNAYQLDFVDGLMIFKMLHPAFFGLLIGLYKTNKELFKDVDHINDKLDERFKKNLKRYGLEAMANNLQAT